MRHTGKIYGSLILAMIIIAALILPASAAGVIGDSTGGTVQSINWEKHSNSFFDAAFTESRSQAFGDGSKDHIQLSGNSAKFFGYETTSYIDYLYYKEANPGKQTFTFSISADETTDFHALCTISFLMNCVQVNGKYSGYMFSIEEGKMAIRILDDLDLDKISNPEDPDFDSRIGNKLIGFRTSEELCPVIDSKSYTTKSGDVFNVKLVSMNTSFTVTVINAETKAVVYNYTLNPADASAKPNAAYAGGNDFGLLCSYDSVDHWCDWLSRAEYQNLTLTSGSINEIVEDEDTGIKLEVGVGVLPVKTIFKVLPVSKGLEFDTINKALADVAEDFNAYDLSFLFNDEVIQPNGDVKVSFPIPNDYAPDDTSIYHLDKDGKVVKMDTDLNADKSFISFESDSFSVYAIVKELNNTPTTTEADATTTAAATTAAVTTVATAAATTAAPNPSTGDSTTLFASMVILAASAASMVFIRRKK